MDRGSEMGVDDLERVSWSDVGITELLDYDDRPTFIVNVHQERSRNPNHQVIAYRNPALLSFLERNAQAGLGSQIENADFVDWAAGLSSSPAVENGLPVVVRYGNRDWKSFTIREKWKVVHCNSKDVLSSSSGDWSTISAKPSGPISVPTMPSQISTGRSTAQQGRGGLGRLSSHSSVSSSTSSRSGFDEGRMLKHIDWTQKSLPGLSKYIQFVRNHDWASTALGPMANWSSQLRQIVVMIMSDPDPRLVLWGPDLTLIYNEACVPLIGEKHPKSLGGSPTDTFAEIWDHLVGIVNLAMHNGKATRVPSMALTMDRHGFPEETMWSFCMVPILGPDGTAIGVLDEFTEATHLSIAERRMSTILRVGENAAAANNLKELWTQVIAALEPNVNDVPYALLYSVSEDRSDESESSIYSGYSTTSKQCLLEGLIGFTKDHPAATTALDLSNDTEDFVIPFQSAWRSGGPFLMQAKTGNLPQVLAASIPGRGFGDTCKEATVLPIHNLSDNAIIAFLLLGLNPRRPHDEDYRQFILFLHDRLIKSAASVFLPEEQRRSQAIAEEIAIRHASLSKQLLQRTQEAERSEAKFTRLAKYAPVGMYLFDPSGSPLYLNDAYFELLGIPKEDGYSSFEQNFWRTEVYPDDLPLVEGQWQYLLDERSPSTFQYRLNRPWKSIDNTNGAEMSGPTWILSTAFPEIDEDGSIIAIMGWLTDISSQKWSERLQAQRLEDALETKRQSENFIDMTSHEMRNPLSAIIQSADGIITALTTPGDKRIVDDILTLSKLDSNLLVITPDQVKPIELVQKALKMYESELDSTKIQARLSIDESYNTLSIDTVAVDPSRLLQVLLNLLTNAIKFTQYQKQRVITIFLSASYNRPSSGPGDVSYIPRRSSRPERSPTPEWGVGRDLYLQFAVQDTGSGITEEEMKVLFLRFSQASPKTYGKYGGSGLGLFISRELTELQGGQIGVHSVAGQGSTFTFYIKGRRWQPEKVITTEESDARASDPLYATPLSPRPGSFRAPPPHSFRASPSNLIASTPPPPPPLPATVVPQKLAPDSLHVLNVEDNLINQRVMAQQLRRLGCTVHIADHGLEALSFLSTTTFSVTTPATKLTADNITGTVPLSVILMDLEMPVMDGLTCVRRIWQMEQEGQLNSQVPVIAVTANARSEQIAHALEQGMDVVVTKPFRIPDLLPQMEALVSRVDKDEKSG
ncbi:hypothetical protein B0A49_07409 [Cryomyces minteri]|uniref:histidine kinase n=1 Tax=Cryomyces minteri TaxID=331657 RepID=A0A4U0X0Q4_9PEZI|nr:hypothetical protein B0A49_07409 [Cryomyces minteri]